MEREIDKQLSQEKITPQEKHERELEEIENLVYGFGSKISQFEENNRSIKELEEEFTNLMRDIEKTEIWQNASQTQKEGIEKWRNSVISALQDNDYRRLTELFGTGVGDEVEDVGPDHIDEELEEAGYFQCPDCQRWQKGFGEEDPYYVLCQSGCTNPECAHYSSPESTEKIEKK